MLSPRTRGPRRCGSALYRADDHANEKGELEVREGRRLNATRERRVLVVGAGGLGTVYGAALAGAGAHVQLLTRRPHAEAIRRAGGVEVRRPEDRSMVALTAE